WMACGTSGKVIVERAAEQGWMILMETVARAKVLAGLTTFQEIDRVAKFTEAKSKAQERRYYEQTARAAAAAAEARANAAGAPPDQADEPDAIEAEFWDDIHGAAESDDPLDI